MNLLQSIKSSAIDYESKVRHLIYQKPDEGIFNWLRKYPISTRTHLFDIVQDVVSNCNSVQIIDQGAAEGIVCRILKDYGHYCTAMDIEPAFSEMWQILGVDGIVGDCMNEKNYNGKHYDVIIATVWATCFGTKNKRKSSMDNAKRLHMNTLCCAWNVILSTNGVVYADVATNRFPLKETLKLFSSFFSVDILTNKPRIIVRLKKN